MKTKKTINRIVKFGGQSLKAAAITGALSLASFGLHAANATKLDTTSLVTNSVNWSGGSGTGGTVATTDIGCFGATPQAATLAGLSLQSTNITLGGLIFSNSLAGPVTIASGGTLTLGSSGIDMSAANTNVYAKCTLTIGASQTWNVGPGITLTNGSLNGYGLVLTKAGAGSLILNSVSASSGGGGEGFLVTGGNCTASSVSIGRNNALTIGATGVPSTIGTTSGFYVGSSANAVSLGTLYIGQGNSGAYGRQDGGTVTLSGLFQLGKTTWNAASRSSGFQVNGGTFTSTDTAIGLQLAPNNGANANYAVLYLTGGTTTFQKIGFGAATDTAGGGGYLTLAGGTLYVGAGGIAKSNTIASYTPYICLNSGTLGAVANWSSTLPIYLNGSATIQAADSSGAAHNITLSGAISTISGTGALTKTGTGVLTLAGTNTYTGKTDVSAGELLGVTGGSISNTTSCVVEAGASLGVRLQTAGGQWTTTNVIATNASYIDINFNGFAPSTTAAPLVVLGNLATTNTLNFIIHGSSLTPGIYPVVSYGSQSGTLPAVPTRVMSGCYLSNDLAVTKRIYLVVTNTVISAEPLVWAGGTGNWNQTDTNWVDQTGNLVAYQDLIPDQVLFEDTSAGGTVAIPLVVNPGSVTFSNNVNTYTISGPGAISGTTALTMNGTNSVTITAANSYTGGTVINSGGLTISGSGNLGTGQVTLNGGTLYQNGDYIANAISNTPSATSTMIYSGGSYYPTLTLIGSGTVNLDITSGVFSPFSYMSGFSGTVNLSGAVRTYNTPTFGSTNSTWNFGTNGSVYCRNGGATTYYFGALTGEGGSVIQGAITAGSGFIPAYVGYLGTSTTFGGVLEDGSYGLLKLVKVGAGSLTLTNANLYTGPTIISNGTLEVDGSLSTTPTTNYSGATLAGIGTISGVVDLEAGSTLAPGVAGAGNYGTFTCLGGLVYNGGTDLMDVSTNGCDLLVVYGGLSLLNGGTVALNINGGLTNGNYPLITYDYIASGTVANLRLMPTTAGSQSFSLVDNGSGTISLQVSSAGNQSLVWASTAEGAVNNYWDVNNTANWTNTATHALGVFVNGDTVTFNDFGAANSPVYLDNVTGSLQPSAVNVNGTQPYELTGPGKISGTAQLVVSSYSSTLTVNNYNDYSGPTVINSGTVQVGDGTTPGTSLGSGPVTNNSALVFNQPDTNSVTSITGTGSLTLSGTGKTIITGNASYTGATLITNTGTLEFGSGGATTVPKSIITITNNGTVGFNLSGALLLTNGVTGLGALSLDGQATVTLAGTNNTYLDNTWVRNGKLVLGANNIIPSAGTVTNSTGWLVLDGGISAAGTVDLNGFNQRLNALSGLTSTFLGTITNSAASGTNVLTVATLAGESSGYAGSIADNTNSSRIAVVVTGPGLQALTGNNTYSGGTVVSNGTLAVGGPSSVGNGGVTLLGGTLSNAVNNVNFSGNSLTVPASKTGVLDLQPLNVMPALYGSGTLDVNVTATQAGNHSNSYGDEPAACVNFSGTLNMTGVVASAYVNLFINGGLTDGQFQNCTVNLDSVTMVGQCGSGGSTAQFGVLNVHNNATLGGSAYGGTLTYQIGVLGGVSDIQGSVTGNGAITKVGSGTLTLDGTLSYTGNTIVNAGVLAIGSVNNSGTSLDSSPAITVSSNAVLDVSARSDATLNLGNSISQSLTANGTINGSLLTAANGATIRLGNNANVIGNLNVTGNVDLEPGSTAYFKLNRTNSQTADEISAAGTITVNGGTLIVTNLGSDLLTSNKFQLFNKAIVGTGFTAISLPVSNALNTIQYTYQTNLAVDGSILVLQGASPIATNPTNITVTVSGNSLTLSWPADHLGWLLEEQTNALTTGLANNWVTNYGTASVTSTNMVIDPNNGAVFYRLVKP